MSNTSDRPAWITIVTVFTISVIHFPARSYKLLDKLATVEASDPGADIMRLHLISSAVVLYTLAVMAWLCYVGIGATP